MIIRTKGDAIIALAALKCSAGKKNISLDREVE
jgi:hypothetical protein